MKNDNHVWDNKHPTAQMLGRWQPWHEGHQKLFEEILKKTGQVNIMVRETVEILIEKIENPEARPQKIKVDGPLILRKSAKIHKGN